MRALGNNSLIINGDYSHHSAVVQAEKSELLSIWLRQYCKFEELLIVRGVKANQRLRLRPNLRPFFRVLNATPNEVMDVNLI